MATSIVVLALNRTGPAYHEAGVDGAPDDAPQGIPGAVIEPVVEIVEAFLRQILGGAVVEVGVKLMNDRFKPNKEKIYQFVPLSVLWSLILVHPFVSTA